jgi:hypothetical protein
MLSIGLAKRCLMRVSAFGTALLLVGCGGGGDKKIEVSAPTTAAAVNTTAFAPTTVVAVATTALTTGTRSSVPTTTLLPRADTDITMDLIPEHNMTYYSPSFKPLAMNGVSYVNALKMYSQKSPTKLEINASRSRSHFRGSLGIPDDESSASSHQVEISFDEAAPAYSTVVNFGETKEIDLDVTGVLRVRVTVSSMTSAGGFVAIGNPRFA